jgi:hypothetical protein
MDSQMAVRLSTLRVGRPLPSGRFLVLISVRGWVDPRFILRLEGLDQLKNLMSSSGIETASFRLVAKCLNQLRCCVPPDGSMRHSMIKRKVFFNTWIVFWLDYCETSLHSHQKVKEHLLGLFSDFEDEGDMFHRNVGCLSTDYTILYPRR